MAKDGSNIYPHTPRNSQLMKSLEVLAARAFSSPLVTIVSRFVLRNALGVGDPSSWGKHSERHRQARLRSSQCAASLPSKALLPLLPKRDLAFCPWRRRDYQGTSCDTLSCLATRWTSPGRALPAPLDVPRKLADALTVRRDSY
ncbi:Os03g0572950 [Oryza sativa Japonica Group]|uniref:Os03g0572950 protein n=2 Tax=Oryza sativa subsp. japonica TaxID=39947 RepID=A3AJR8_ORYSJ|nr:hypothetical protein OsJ_11505 [Oryza sativa Japonica Group]BAS85002.1 Os03g0572950 [Oryza sativa Japonica Group]